MENDQDPFPAGTGDVNDPVIFGISFLCPFRHPSYYALPFPMSLPILSMSIPSAQLLPIVFSPGFIGPPSPIIPRHVFLLCVFITAQTSPVFVRCV